MFMVNPIEAFLHGGIIAYPTEAVFGLGCDPDNQEAIKKLLAIKKRPIEKGLILLAADYSQLLPYINDNHIPQDKRDTILSRWPDGITQVLPANKNISPLLCGQFTTIAVRITSHPEVVKLCNVVNKPIVSTSANLTGQPPAKSYKTLDKDLIKQIDSIIKKPTLGYTQPSTIIDGLTGETFRV
jgi:L-threonylcarbamoyladenylate synthase